MPTRRTMLAAAGTTLLSGCLYVRQARDVFRCGVAAGSDAPQGRMFSGKLDRFGGPPIPYLVQLPAGAAVTSIRDVYYFLPGRSAHDDDAIGWIWGGQLTEAVRAGVPPFAVASLAAGDTYFHHRAGGEDRGAAVRGPLARAVAYHLGRRPRREAIGGYSMGGYGALLAAEQERGRYVAVACAAPALFLNFRAEDQAVGDAFDDAAQYAANDVFLHGDRLPRRVLLRVGTDDPFRGAVTAFAKRYPRVRLDIEPGCHAGAFAVSSAAPLLRFAGDALADG